MSEQKKRLIEKAGRKYGRLSPCGGRKSLDECFTHHGEALLFWFNTDENTTHVEVGETAGQQDVKAPGAEKRK
jgi:hypothetical protein